MSLYTHKCTLMHVYVLACIHLNNYIGLCKNKLMYACVRAVVHVRKFYLCMQLLCVLLL